MAIDNDPRVYFAAERTLLAWVRTGLTVIGLGFVVARFNLFLVISRGDQAPSSFFGPTLIGIGLVLLGSGAVAMAAWQHLQFTRELAPHERPRSYLVNWSIWFAVLLSITGVLLAVYISMQENRK